ncbi:unnamed protein product [Paramecium sonneborni]|uniref:Tubulin--tyrosine ligase-like protein 5 n=1 Tax=Paramecium sonneborni TaxID=65129 RepID=A0A8S1L7Q6_9CILI|nr:unnamed protein product [Paramecium sonneborni]
MRQQLQLTGDSTLSQSTMQRRNSNKKQKSPIQGRRLFLSHVIQTPQSLQQVQTQQQQQQEYQQHIIQGRSHSQSNVVFQEEVPQKWPIIQLPFLKNTQPTIFFQYPPVCEDKRPLVNARPMTEEEVKKYQLTCRVLGSAPYKCVLTSFDWAGFKRIDEDDDEDEEWNVQWGIGNKSTLRNMNRYQKINHFPGCWNMGRKDLLWLNLSKFKRKYPKEYNFIPNTYLLQYDYDRFMMAQDSAQKDTLWIKKPCADSRGRGITMVSKKSKVKKDKNFLIMDYIYNPHLINGYKYDLRVYVLISCFDPLRVYMYKDGLVRFATQKYSTNSKDLTKRYIHLTNFAVNKLSPNFVKNQNTQKDDEGSKWSHQAYRKKLDELGINSRELFMRIQDVVLKTCIATEPFMLDSNAKSLEHRNGYFELYGFDVLIDENLKPWVLEVNVSPSLNSSSPLDKKIKTSLISDVLHLVGVPLWDKKNYKIGSPPKYNQRNIKDIPNINSSNCLNKLSQNDVSMLIHTIEEAKRRGKNFSCIFPNPKTIHQYMDLFEFPRFNNKLVERFYQDKCNWLSRFN